MKPNVSPTAARAALVASLIAALATIPSAQTAAPTFTVRGPSDVGEANPREAVATDFNHDGHLDLVVTTSFAMAAPTSHKINLLRNDGTGVFAQVPAIPLGNAGGIAVADFNRDGMLDLAVTSAGSTQCLGQGTAIFLGAPGPIPFVFRAPCLNGVASPVAAQAGDFNGDGRADLAVASSTGASMMIYRGNGDGSFLGGQVVNSSNLIVQDMAPAVDVNRDGFLDIVVGATNTFRAFLGRGDGTFDAGAGTVTGDNTLAVALADVTGDSIQDLAMIEQVSGGGQLRVRPGIGNGAFNLGTIYPIGPGGVADLAIADLDNDGDMDIAVAGGSLLKARLFVNDGSGLFAQSSIEPLGADPYRAVTGDFNGDGLSDVAMIGPRQIQPAQVFVALQDFRDRISPTVDITSPADGSSVSGMVNVSATANDNVGVTRVDFFANGESIGSDSTGPDYSVTWDASQESGNFTITARAFDAAGNSAEDSVSVTVVDNASPSAPTNLRAEALDNFHVVSLSWDAATDNSGVDHYRVYELVRRGRNTSVWELIVDNVEGTSALAEIKGRRGQVHTYAVTAVDAAGNESERSEPAEISKRDRDQGGDDDRGRDRQ